MSVRKRKWRTSSGEVHEAWIVEYNRGEGKRSIKTFTSQKDADAFAQSMAPENDIPQTIAEMLLRLRDPNRGDLTRVERAFLCGFIHGATEALPPLPPPADDDDDLLNNNGVTQ
jgi:hypothetical protein